MHLCTTPVINFFVDHNVWEYASFKLAQDRTPKDMCCCSGIASSTEAFVTKLQIASLAQPSLALGCFVTAKYCQIQCRLKLSLSRRAACPPRAGGALPLTGRGLRPRHRGPPHTRRHARGALRQHVGARVDGEALASRRGLARPGRALGTPPACALAWLPFSRTHVMGLPARGAGTRKPTGSPSVQPRQTDAVDQFVAREGDCCKAKSFSQRVLCQ